MLLSTFSADDDDDQPQRDAAGIRLVDFVPDAATTYSERLIPSSLFVRVSVGAHPRSSKASVFFEVEDLRRECVRIWPGSGVLVDCYAQVAHEHQEWTMSRCIEEANLRARQLARSMVVRLSGEKDSPRRFMRAKFRVDVFPLHGCVMARYLSEEEWAYEVAELGADVDMWEESERQRISIKVTQGDMNEGPADPISDTEFELPKRLERIFANRVIRRRMAENLTPGGPGYEIPTIEELVDLGDADAAHEIEAELFRRLDGEAGS